MGRKRLYNDSDRPANVKIWKAPNGKTYFKYVFPDGETRSLGTDRSAAFEAARTINTRLMQMPDLVDEVMLAHGAGATSKNPTMKHLLDRFTTERLEKRGYSARTLQEKMYQINQYRRLWAMRTVQSMTVADFASFLDEQTANTFTKHRPVLAEVMQFATHCGYRADNPVEATIKRSAERIVVTRGRHTWEGYQQIYQAAEPYMQLAMDLALYSLQRRSDLTSLQKSQVDMEQNTITILQSKTKNYGKPVYIKIQMSADLRSVVEGALANKNFCPFLISRVPKRQTKLHAKGKAHRLAVTPDLLTKEFVKLRDKVGAYNHLPKDARPTFHSIRSLGIFMYELAGYSDEYTSGLSGHATQSMLNHYKDGYAVKPKNVSAGLTKQQIESIAWPEDWIEPWKRA